MEKLTLTMKLENAAFEDDPAGEIARILEKAASDLIEDGEIVHHGGRLTLRDVNGNTVGKLVIS